MRISASERIRRFLRALQQAGGAAVVVGIIIVFVELTDKQATALTGGLTAAFAWIQNALEEKIGKDIGIARSDEAAEDAPAL